MSDPLPPKLAQGCWWASVSLTSPAYPIVLSQSGDPGSVLLAQCQCKAQSTATHSHKADAQAHVYTSLQCTLNHAWACSYLAMLLPCQSTLLVQTPQRMCTDNPTPPQSCAGYHTSCFMGCSANSQPCPATTVTATLQSHLVARLAIPCPTAESAHRKAPLALLALRPLHHSCWLSWVPAVLPTATPAVPSAAPVAD